MIRIVLISLFALVAGPVLAERSLLHDCSETPVGEGACDPGAVAKAIDVLAPGNFRIYREAGMESFAMHYALSLANKGLMNRIADGDCVINDEVVYEAGDIWFFYVTPSLPENADAELAGRFRVIDGLFNNVLAYVQKGEC